MLSSLKISAQSLSLVTLSVRVHSVRATADPWKVYLSLLEVQDFPKAFGDESGTSLSIPQILGDTAGSLSVSHGSVLERKILSSPWDLMTEHLWLSVGTLILCVSQFQLCNKHPARMGLKCQTGVCSQLEGSADSDGAQSGSAG